MHPLDLIPAIDFGDGELRIDFGDGEADLYRIKDGQLEFLSDRSPNPAWYPLTPEEILQHVALHTPVAVWLHVRLRLRTAIEIRNRLLFEELNVPESLQCEENRTWLCPFQKTA